MLDQLGGQQPVRDLSGSSGALWNVRKWFHWSLWPSQHPVGGIVWFRMGQFFHGGGEWWGRPVIVFHFSTGLLRGTARLWVTSLRLEITLDQNNGTNSLIWLLKLLWSSLGQTHEWNLSQTGICDLSRRPPSEGLLRFHTMLIFMELCWTWFQEIGGVKRDSVNQPFLLHRRGAAPGEGELPHTHIGL